MKFRNPETGEVVSIPVAVSRYCKTKGRWCCKCSLPGAINQSGKPCEPWVETHPHEAARLMGFEVVEDETEDSMFYSQSLEVLNPAKAIREALEKEANMDKPRICEVLGVEVDEEWTVSGNDIAIYRVSGGVALEYAMPKYNGSGYGQWLPAGMPCLVDFINHPDRIIRKPRFTQQEVEDAKYIKRILKVDSVRRNIYGNGLIAMKSDNIVSIVVNSEMFPSIHPGQSVTLDEIIGGAE